MARVVSLVVLGVVVGFFAGRLTAPGEAPPARESRQRDVARALPEQRDTYAPRVSGDSAAADDASGSATTRDATTRPRASRPRGERALVRRLIRAAYDKRASTGTPPEADLFDAAVEEALRATEHYRDSVARGLGAQVVTRQQQRAEFGEITGFPLVLQIQAPGSANVSLVSHGGPEEFPIVLPPVSGPATAYVRGGTIPPGQTLVIEEVRLRMVIGRNGSATLRLGSQGAFPYRGERTVEMRLAGLQLVAHGQASRISLYGHRAAAGAEIRGRLVPTAEAARLHSRPLRMAGEGNGFLTDRTPVLQVLADHGGGNPRRVYLDGSTYRIDSVLPGSIWTDEPNLRGLRNSIAHYENCGLIPPGKAYRITRVAYRVILDKRSGGQSRFDIRIGKEKIEGNAAERDTFDGVWNGDVLLHPGDETKVVVTCHYYGLAEVTVFGKLVDGE